MINASNYKEYLLGYMDNQVDATTRRAVEAYIQVHPEVKEELAALKATRLIPDEKIVFKNKHLLLKEETPVHQLSWHRVTYVVAIAAMLVGFILWVSFFRTSDTIVKPIAESTKPAIKEKAGNPVNPNIPANQKEENTPQLANITVQKEKVQSQLIHDKHTKKNVAANLPVRTGKEEKKEEKQVVVSPIPNLLNNTAQAPQIPGKVEIVQRDTTLFGAKKPGVDTLSPNIIMAINSPVGTMENPKKGILNRIGHFFKTGIKVKRKDADGNTYFAIDLNWDNVSISETVKK